MAREREKDFLIKAIIPRTFLLVKLHTDVTYSSKCVHWFFTFEWIDDDCLPCLNLNAMNTGTNVFYFEIKSIISVLLDISIVDMRKPLYKIPLRLPAMRNYSEGWKIATLESEIDALSINMFVT